jgi:hypothetical protein
LEILEDNYIRHTTKMEPIVDPLTAKIDAGRRELRTKLEAIKRESEARMEAIEAKWRVRRLEMEANRRERLAKMKATWKKGNEEWNKTYMGIGRKSTETCEGNTEAFLEKGSAPEEPESVAEPKEVPESATEQETGQATEDRNGELRLAVRRHRQWKKRAQENGGPRQKFAAFHRRVTCRAVPALIKGPKRNRRSGVKGLGKTSGSRIENWGLKECRTKDKAV